MVGLLSNTAAFPVLSVVAILVTEPQRLPPFGMLDLAPSWEIQPHFFHMAAFNEGI
jgi:hypothetical protein